MKNKVLRLAIVAILVVAMVLSMAACGPTTPVEPTPTPGQTSPTPAPTTPTPKPTVSPVVPGATDEALAKATYGIELIGTNFTYGKILEDMSKPVSTTNKSLSTVEVKVTGDLLKNFKDLVIKWTVEYDGEGKLIKPDADSNTKDSYAIDGMKLTFTEDAPAGTYTVTAQVTAEDNGFYFGRFGALKDEKVTYELATIVNVAKADLTITVPNYVAPVKATGDTVYESAYEAFNIGTVDPYDGKYEFMIKAGTMVDNGTVGSYDLVITAHKDGTTATGAKDTTIVPFEDLVAINHNVTFVNGKQYFISAYDWNVIRDTATSIAELETKYTNKVELGTDGLNKIKLARARYDALTTEQKAFFATGAIAATVTVGKTPDATYNGTIKTTDISNASDWELATGNIAKVVAGTGTAAAITTGKQLYTYLEKSEKAAENQAVINAWDKAVKDAKFDLYMGESFNIDNATHVAAFNTVDKYFTGLSTANQDVIKADDGANYKGYVAAKAKFAGKAYKQVQELIAGAAAAYNNAIVNLTTGGIVKSIFEDKLDAGNNKYEGVVYYINSAEVKALTAQAQAAYDKLSSDEKKELAKLSVLTGGTDDAKIATNFDKVNSKDTTNPTINYSYTHILKSLTTMNAVVGYMEQVINHTKIEDLFHTDTKSPAYKSLNTIVFGGAANYLTADWTKGADENGATTFNAVSDIIRAFTVDPASLDAVVAEYKAMIDYVLAGETYKAEQIANLKAGIAAEFVADDYTEIQIANATSATNKVLGGIVLGITNEKDSKYAFVTVLNTLPTAFTAPAIVKATVQEILNKTALESYDEAIEAFEGLYNMDKALSVFLANYAKTVADYKTTSFVGAVGDMVFTYGA